MKNAAIKLYNLIQTHGSDVCIDTHSNYGEFDAAMGELRPFLSVSKFDGFIEGPYMRNGKAIISWDEAGEMIIDINGNVELYGENK